MAAELPQDVGHLYAHFIHTPAAVTGYASQIAGRPWSCSAHAKDIWTSPDWELKQNLAATQWVATCTRFGWEHLRALSAQPDATHLIYHGLDLTRFPAPASGDASQRTGHDAAHPVRFLSVGRAVDKKGFDTLLDALALLPETLHWQWQHIGGGALSGAFKAQADRLGIGEQITWSGSQPQTEVLDAYRQSDLFILPCRITDDGDRDGLPNVLVEAQSQGVSCISTPISGVPELITDGETGLLTPPNDAPALAAAIVELARHPDRRARLAAAGQARVREAFDMNAGLEQLGALFRASNVPYTARAPSSIEAAE